MVELQTTLACPRHCGLWQHWLFWNRVRFLSIKSLLFLVAIEALDQDVDRDENAEDDDERDEGLDAASAASAVVVVAGAATAALVSCGTAAWEILLQATA